MLPGRPGLPLPSCAGAEQPKLKLRDSASMMTAVMKRHGPSIRSPGRVSSFEFIAMFRILFPRLNAASFIEPLKRTCRAICKVQGMPFD